MESLRHKDEFYRRLFRDLPAIYEAGKKVADEIGIPGELRGNFGISGTISSCPALLRREISAAMERASRQVIELKDLAQELRDIVKDVYGDEYDAVALSTCEAALWVCLDVLATPPFTGRGTSYRTCYLAPYERHMHHQGAYGRPFPPRYKDLFADRGVTAGEMGFYGKRLSDLDTVMTRLVGAKYECHGFKYNPAVLLLHVDADASIKRMARMAEIHADRLSAVVSLGFDTPGYGYGKKDARGAPRLQSLMSELAHDYEVPYIVDNATGVPFVGLDPRDNGADLMLYSMDKAAGGPHAGLIIGKEEVMVPIRRALGVGGTRGGDPLSFGKAAYVTNDPGKEALVGVIATLKGLREHPELITKPVDQTYEIVSEEFEGLQKAFGHRLVITKSYNCGSVEVNYEDTWEDGKIGIPIFTIEDMYAGVALFQTGLAKMGVVPTIAYDANIVVTPGLGTIDEEGNLIEDRMRYGVRALAKLMELTCEHMAVT